MEPVNDARVVAEALARSDALEKIWGSPRLGLLLTAAHVNKQPVGTDELAAKLDVSDETIRRKIQPLWNIGRVESVKQGRNIRYCASAEWTARTVAVLIECRPTLSKVN